MRKAEDDFASRMNDESVVSGAKLTTKVYVVSKDPNRVDANPAAHGSGVCRAEYVAHVDLSDNPLPIPGVPRDMRVETNGLMGTAAPHRLSRVC
jgi:hypothetical protein